MDHMSFLGSTISLIAKEKFGIVKNSERVVISKQRKYVKSLTKKFLNKKIPIYEEGNNWKVNDINHKKKNLL